MESFRAEAVPVIKPGQRPISINNNNPGFFIDNGAVVKYVKIAFAPKQKSLFLDFLTEKQAFLKCYLIAIGLFYKDFDNIISVGI